MVGVNFAVSFLRPDGRQDRDTPVELIVDHVEHMLAQVGEDGVGFGSDFDGAMIPKRLGNAAGLPALVEAMRTRGYSQPLIEKLCFRNWLRVLERTWSEHLASLPASRAANTTGFPRWRLNSRAAPWRCWLRSAAI